MAEEERILEVTPDFDGKRIDQCLAASFSDCSRSFLQKLLKDGKVSINGKTQKASSKVAAGDAVLVLLPEPEELNVELRHQQRSEPRNRPQNRYGHNGCPCYL